MLNYVMMMGRLTADPEVRSTESGSELATFSIAVQRPKRKDGAESGADFFNCVAWSGKARIVSEWYHKGDMIMIVGTLRNRKYTDKNGNKRTYEQIIVKEIYFTGGQKKNSCSSDDSDLPPTPDELKKMTVPNEEDIADIEDFLDDDGVPF